MRFKLFVGIVFIIFIGVFLNMQVLAADTDVSSNSGISAKKNIVINYLAEWLTINPAANKMEVFIQPKVKFVSELQSFELEKSYLNKDFTKLIIICDQDLIPISISSGNINCNESSVNVNGSIQSLINSPFDQYSFGNTQITFIPIDNFFDEKIKKIIESYLKEQVRGLIYKNDLDSQNNLYSNMIVPFILSMMFYIVFILLLFLMIKQSRFDLRSSVFNRVLNKYKYLNLYFLLSIFAFVIIFPLFLYIMLGSQIISNDFFNIIMQGYLQPRALFRTNLGIPLIIGLSLLSMLILLSVISPVGKILYKYSDYLFLHTSNNLGKIYFSLIFVLLFICLLPGNNISYILSFLIPFLFSCIVYSKQYGKNNFLVYSGLFLYLIVSIIYSYRSYTFATSDQKDLVKIEDAFNRSKLPLYINNDDLPFISLENWGTRNIFINNFPLYSNSFSEIVVKSVINFKEDGNYILDYDGSAYSDAFVLDHYDELINLNLLESNKRPNLGTDNIVFKLDSAESIDGLITLIFDYRCEQKLEPQEISINLKSRNVDFRDKGSTVLMFPGCNQFENESISIKLPVESFSPNIYLLKVSSNNNDFFKAANLGFKTNIAEYQIIKTAAVYSLAKSEKKLTLYLFSDLESFSYVPSESGLNAQLKKFIDLGLGDNGAVLWSCTKCLSSFYSVGFVPN